MLKVQRINSSKLKVQRIKSSKDKKFKVQEGFLGLEKFVVIF